MNGWSKHQQQIDNFAEYPYCTSGPSGFGNDSVDPSIFKTISEEYFKIGQKSIQLANWERVLMEKEQRLYQMEQMLSKQCFSPNYSHSKSFHQPTSSSKNSSSYHKRSRSKSRSHSSERNYKKYDSSSHNRRPDLSKKYSRYDDRHNSSEESKYSHSKNYKSESNHDKYEDNSSHSYRKSYPLNKSKDSNENFRSIRENNDGKIQVVRENNKIRISLCKSKDLTEDEKKEVDEMESNEGNSLFCDANEDNQIEDGQIVTSENEKNQEN